MVGAPTGRRGFLGSLATAALAGVTPLWSGPGLLVLRQMFEDIPRITPRPARRPRRVVVLGAGLSGMCAGYELSNLGHDVTILEARNRPGGRVHTLREGFSDGLFAEAGAEIFYTNHRYSVHYCLEFDIPLQPAFPRARIEDTTGKLHLRGETYERRAIAADPTILPFDLTSRDLDVLRAGPPVSGLSFIDFIARYYAPDNPGRLAAAGIPDLPDLEALDRVPIGEYLRERGASEGLLALIGFSLDHVYNANALDRVSPLYVLMDEAIGLRSGHRYRIIGGNDLFPLAFAKRLSEKIRYGAPVVRIEQDASEARVVYRQGGREKTLRADYVVCTLPIPTLRRVAIEPAFREAKMKAIREVTYASVYKFFLQTRRRYWIEEGWNGSASMDLPIGSVRHVTGEQPGPRGLFQTYATAPFAQQLGNLSDERQREEALAQIARVSASVRKYAEDHRSWYWDGEEWNRGGYVVYETGQMTTHLPALIEPDGRVHFGGEHTSLWHVYMNGALESGYRCATEVHQRAEAES